MAHILPPDLTPDILHAFLLRFQLEEAEYRIGHMDDENLDGAYLDVAYTETGFRELPEVKIRSALIQERQQIVASIEKLYPIFQPPVSVRMASKQIVKKIELPSQNAIRLIMGPKGSDIKELEKEFGVKISFRGASASWEYDNEGNDANPLALIVGSHEENVEKCFRSVKSILEDRNEEIADGKPEDEDMEMHLSFDPSEEIPPWGYAESNDKMKGNSEEVESAVRELMRELNQGKKARTEEESSVRRGLLDRYNSDLAYVDISNVLPVPEPPGTSVA